MRGHYHCLRTGCYFVTNITTKLPWHLKKHEKAERRAANGFKYFTKREECGRLGTGAGQGLAAAQRPVAWPRGPGGLGHLSQHLPPAPAHQVPCFVETVTDITGTVKLGNSQDPRAHDKGVRVTWSSAPTPAKCVGPHRGVQA